MEKISWTDRVRSKVALCRIKEELNILHTGYCAGGEIETNEMGRACGAYG